MGALAPITQWVLEDDILLKNAVEAGASLESLAKGAVHFSRRYSFRELQDRWYSLLYDPVVSAEASVRIIDSERCSSKSNRVDSSKESKSVHGKRRTDSIRRCYYAKRKRIRNEQPYQGVLNYHFLGEPVANQLELRDPNFCGLPSVFPNAPPCDMDGSSHEFQLESQKNLEHDGTHDGIPRVLENSMAENYSGAEEMDQLHPLLEANGTTAHFSTNAVAYFDELLTLPSEEDMLPMDVDEKAVWNDIHMLLSSPEDINEDQNLNLSELKSSVALETCVEIPDRACSGEMNPVGDNDLGIENNLEPQMQSAPSVEDPRGPEYRNGVICCVLNTEDPQIPCNNHVVLPGTEKPESLNKKFSIEAFMKKTPSASQKFHNTVKKELKTFGDLHAGSHTIGSDGVFDCVDGSGVRTERTGIEPIISASRHLSVTHPNQSSLVINREALGTTVAMHSGLKLAEKPILDSDSFKSHFTIAGASNQDGSMPAAFRNQEVNGSFGSRDNLMLEIGAVGSVSDPEQFSDSDDEIPCFSDIESMILDMDLGPDDQDCYSSREVANYQNEDAKRAIIRLEQGAHAYMQRAITSHGAFAVLYGRHSKHYIKKPEVLLGRATDDVIVDIDLGREGRANKISRRQAIIKMEQDGSFHLKNLGKFSILVNNMEVRPKRCHDLQSNCLIEIRGMPFIFETNQACVKRYLDKAAGNL